MGLFRKRLNLAALFMVDDETPEERREREARGEAPKYGYCPRCHERRPLELNWTCCGCGTDVRTEEP